MPVFPIPSRHVFPDPSLADRSGLLGVGGDLSPERVLLGYRMGIFPWYTREQPILWWSPDPRTVLWTHQLHVPRSLGTRIRRHDYTITMDRAFAEVVRACAEVPRPGQWGTWITDEMQEAYLVLHERGHAHSTEAWSDGQLVGGLYGVAVGRLYAGESMFARADDASKVAFVQLVRQLGRWGFPLVDCQVHTEHLARFGAVEIPRAEYLGHVRELVREPAPVARWDLDPDLA